MTTQKSAKPRLLQLSAPQPSSPPASSATLFFFARGMPQKWRKSKPEIYASFNCCSCMRFKAKAIIVRSCVASPLGTGALDTSALAAPMACNGRMSRKNKKKHHPKKVSMNPTNYGLCNLQEFQKQFFQVTFQTYRCRPACLEALPLQTLLSWSVAPSQRWFWSSTKAATHRSSHQKLAKVQGELHPLEKSHKSKLVHQQFARSSPPKKDSLNQSSHSGWLRSPL